MKNLDNEWNIFLQGLCLGASFAFMMTGLLYMFI